MDKNKTVIAIIICFLIVTMGIWLSGRHYRLPAIMHEYEVQRSAPLKNGDAVRATGVIRRVGIARTGMMFVNIQTKDGLELDVVSYPSMGRLPNMKRGELLEVRGVLDRYQNKLQVRPYSRKDIRTHNTKSQADSSEQIGARAGQWI